MKLPVLGCALWHFRHHQCVLLLDGGAAATGWGATTTTGDNNSYKTGKLKLFSFVAGFYMSRCIRPGEYNWISSLVGSLLAAATVEWGCWLYIISNNGHNMAGGHQHGKKLIFYQTIVVAVVVVSLLLVLAGWWVGGWMGWLLCENPIQKWWKYHQPNRKGEKERKKPGNKCSP